MSVLETTLIYGGIPLLVVLATMVFVYGRSAVHQPNRYRPGKPWTYRPVWYLPHAGSLKPADLDRAIEGRARRTTAVGGASGEW